MSPRSFPHAQLHSLPPLFLFSSSIPRPPMSLVYVGQLFLGMGPALECAWYTSYYSTEENRLFFSRSNQVPTAASARCVLRTPCPPPSSGIDFCLLCLHSPFVSLYICPVVSEKKHCFLEVILQLWLLQTFHPFCYLDPEVWGESFNIDYPLRAEHSEVSCYLC